MDGFTSWANRKNLSICKLAEFKMNKELKSKDELALEAYEKTQYAIAKKAVVESEKEGLVIYVNFKTKKVIRYGKV